MNKRIYLRSKHKCCSWILYAKSNSVVQRGSWQSSYKIFYLFSPLVIVLGIKIKQLCKHEEFGFHLESNIESTEEWNSTAEHFQYF